jgi:hypothetical protein
MWNTGEIAADIEIANFAGNDSCIAMGEGAKFQVFSFNDRHGQLSKQKGDGCPSPFDLVIYDGYLFSGLHGKNRYKLAIFLGGAEKYGAWYFCEDCMVAANANACAWVPLGAALAQNDIACNNGFTAEAFYAQTLTS